MVINITINLNNPQYLLLQPSQSSPTSQQSNLSKMAQSKIVNAQGFILEYYENNNTEDSSKVEDKFMDINSDVREQENTNISADIARINAMLYGIPNGNKNEFNNYMEDKYPMNEISINNEINELNNKLDKEYNRKISNGTYNRSDSDAFKYDKMVAMNYLTEQALNQKNTNIERMYKNIQNKMKKIQLEDYYSTNI